MNKYIYGILSLRMIALILSSFYAFSGPHEWRQYDTIGMSYRYFIEFFQSAIQKYPKILPAVLQAGDALGVTPVEIPVLNLFIAPFFLLGESAGTVLAKLALLAINIQLLYFNYQTWKEQEVAGEKTREAFLLIPLLGFSALFFGKFMPDILSVLLVLTALGIATKSQKFLVATLLGGLGLMIKPTSVVVYALFLLMKERKNFKHYIWMGITILVTIFYYKVVNPAILAYAGEKSVFAVGTKPLGVAIKQILEQPKLIFTVFLKSFMSNWIFIPFFVITAYFITKKKIDGKQSLGILGIIFLQWLFLHLLSGDHPYWHNYYYLGISPIVALLFYRTLNVSDGFWRKSLLFILVVLNILQITYDLKPMLKPHKKRAWQITQECQQLKLAATEFPWDQGYHFRSPREFYPILGMCFGEIQNAAETQYGFFYKGEKIPHDCEPKHTSQHLVLASCQ